MNIFIPMQWQNNKNNNNDKFTTITGRAPFFEFQEGLIKGPLLFRIKDLLKKNPLKDRAFFQPWRFWIGIKWYHIS